MAENNEFQLPQYVPAPLAPHGKKWTHGHHKIFPEDDGLKIQFHKHWGGNIEHRHYDHSNIMFLDEVLLPSDTKPWLAHSDDCAACISAVHECTDWEEEHTKRGIEI